MTTLGEKASLTMLRKKNRLDGEQLSLDELA